ncbi:unannotated protein [freshwater metagenome]|uniref:Unannotated protein n=1 Tax=freshwater metagenome TaxID=449393 RepID=A0A6J6PNM7_9ZZZZ
MTVTTTIELRVAPGARRAEVVGRHGDAWKVRVGAAPERGRANQAVIELLAKTLGIPERNITVLAGHTNRSKVVALTGIERAQAEQLLDTAAVKDGAPTAT